MIYLDYAANHPVESDVLDCFLRTERLFPGNPNSAHPAGQLAREQLLRTTRSIASLLDVSPTEVIYTSGATESNNLAVKGIAQAEKHRGRHIISTPLEHASVQESLRFLQRNGWEVDLLDIGRDGTIDLHHLRRLLRSDTVLLTVTAVDSELGTVQPLEAIKQELAAYPDCRLHVDATQAVGRIPLSFDGISSMSFAPHKFGGLNGSGILLKAENVPIEPLLHGGGSSSAYRSGTPSLALAVSTEAALHDALINRKDRALYVQQLRDTLVQQLQTHPFVHINSPENTVPHILNLSVDGVKGTRFQQLLAEQDVCVAVKSACSSDGLPSQAVYAVTQDRRTALSSWRISLSHRTSHREIRDFLLIFDQCCRSLFHSPCNGKENEL